MNFINGLYIENAINAIENNKDTDNFEKHFQKYISVSMNLILYSYRSSRKYGSPSAAGG